MAFNASRSSAVVYYTFNNIAQWLQHGKIGLKCGEYARIQWQLQQKKER